MITLGGCASTQQNIPPLPDPGPPDSSSETQCDKRLAALIGGAIGAIIYEENRARGAAVGAGLGALACSIIDAISKEIRTPSEVEKEYRASHNGRLPERPLVAAYDTAYNAGGGVRRGESARVVSNITVVPGANEPVHDLREVLEVFDPVGSGEPIIRVEKRVEETPRTGTIQNSFSIRLPAGVAPGSYPARTTLYVNDKPAGENAGNLRVES
jgi:hypothetical protein